MNVVDSHSKKYVVDFRGLNYGEGYTEGEFSDCKNISIEKYPCLSPRYGRKDFVDIVDQPSTLFVKDNRLLAVIGEGVWRVDSDGSFTWVGSVSSGRKQIASVGNYILVFPDKVYYNDETGEFGQMEWTVTGRPYYDLVFGTDSVTAKSDMYTRMSGVRVGDAITFSGFEDGDIGANNKTAVVRKIEEHPAGDDDPWTSLYFDENTFVEHGREKPNGTTWNSITLTREIPDLEYLCECNGRLWGVSGNTIYGSKYGDPLNFNVFDGLTHDSYYIDIGSGGAFTGCAPFSGHVCFFKENVIHKLYGSRPSNYQIVTAQVPGVQSGSERSLCVINDVLYYKGVHGVYSYAGSVPELVSHQFGTKKFKNACAGTDGTRYYISMEGTDGWHLLVYDTMRDMWVQEDTEQYNNIVSMNGKVYLSTAEGNYVTYADETAGQSDIDWSVTFCPFCETINERKGYSKFHLRLELGEGARFAVEIKRDTDTEWETVYSVTSEKARTISIPVLPARCDSVEVRLNGRGKFLLRTFIREFFTGSDV